MRMIYQFLQYVLEVFFGIYIWATPDGYTQKSPLEIGPFSYCEKCGKERWTQFYARDMPSEWKCECRGEK